MKNGWIQKIRGRVRLKIKGKNIERFLRKLYHQKIELLHITYPKRNEVIVEIFKEDYDRVLEMKTVYEVALVDIEGTLKIKKIIKMNRFLVLAFVVGMGILLMLSNIIYKVEIVHTNKELRNLLFSELEERGVKEKSFKKSFHELEKIKKEIVNEHRDKIEWLEIETIGTKYVVRVEMRKVVQPKQESGNQNVVAAKGAIIRKVIAENGEIVRNTNDYVNAGDVVISGAITLNEEVKNYTRASGKIYGEVWYKAEVTYPFYRYEERKTGKKKKALVIKLLHHEWEVSFSKPYYHKKVKAKPLLQHLFLPLSISWQEQEEFVIKEEMNTEEQAIEKAQVYAYQKIKSKLNDKEEIISQKNLKVNIKNSKIVVDIFFTVLEDITSYQKIEDLPEAKESNR